jgi:hypothetical protein
MGTRPLILAVAVTALAFVSLPLLAAEHPDITGTWAIDAPKSDFGAMPAPNDLVVTVKAAGDGKTMTTERQISGPTGEGQMRMVFNRK